MLFRTRALAMLLLGIFVPLARVPSALGQTDAADIPRRILIITGEDQYHDWQRTTPVLLELLEQDPRLSVEVLSDLTQFRAMELEPYHVIVLHFKNRNPEIPGREAFENLRAFVNQGGGLVLVHFACGAFEEFKQELVEITGRVWMGIPAPAGRRQHDRRGPFIVNIADDAHPITAGMTDFGTDDELYTCLEGDSPVRILATAVSKVDRQSYPMVMVRQYGDGRVFNCTLGHDVRAFKTEMVGEFYRRGCAWAAGLPPVPPAGPRAKQ